jgi:hypothetical protein
MIPGLKTTWSSVCQWLNAKQAGEEAQFGTALLQFTTTTELNPEDALQHATGKSWITSLPSNSRATKSRPGWHLPAVGMLVEAV